MASHLKAKVYKQHTKYMLHVKYIQFNFYKHNVTISSKSWRTKAGNKAKLLPIIEKKIKV